MKILSAAQVRAVDAYTIAQEPVASVNLMERAAQAFVDWFTQHYWNTPRVEVFCGLGNNGGDGLAIARLLQQFHYAVAVYVVRYAEETSADFAVNLERLERQSAAENIRSASDMPVIRPDSIVIDALFGSGLSRPVDGLAAAVIEAINRSPATVVAVDIPSGLFMDTPQAGNSIVRARHTVSFQLPKLAFLLAENERFVGQWHLVDIGLHPIPIQEAGTPHHYVDENLIKGYLKPRLQFSHKGLYGHALLVAGSYGKMGAAILAAKACLRSGVGLLTLHVPWCGYEIMQISVPEAMVVTDADGQHFSGLADSTGFTTIGIGPGLGQEPITAEGFQKLLQRLDSPMVLDADALNLLAANPGWLPLLPPDSILTPHPKEFERMAGATANSYERLERLKAFAKKYRVIVVLKGAHSATALPSGEVYFNSTGNPGMATGGTGDVLTGMLTALVAQQYPPAHAAVLGVYLHGRAGDQAAQTKGYAGLIASDLIASLPETFADFGI